MFREIKVGRSTCENLLDVVIQFPRKAIADSLYDRSVYKGTEDVSGMKAAFRSPFRGRYTLSPRITTNVHTFGSYSATSEYDKAGIGTTNFSTAVSPHCMCSCVVEAT